MNTQAISGPANILAPAPASGNSAALSNTADIPFNQVLQREVSERRNADQPKQSESHQSEEKSPRQDSAAQATTGTGKSDAASKSKDEAEETDDTEQLSDAGNASSELIALVTSMAQIIPSATDARSTVSADESATQFDPSATNGKGKRLILGIEGQAANLDSTDRSQATGDLLRAGSDFTQMVNDASKMSVNAVSAQQVSTAQTASLQNGAIPLDSLVSQQAGLAPEAGTLSTISPLAPMQHALNKVQAATTLAADHLAPPVGTPAWDQAVGQKVTWMVAGAQQSASLTLNPPDLGPMQIVLNVNNTQASATFVAAQPEVRQALEAALPKLREMLGEAGIQLGQTNINAGTPQQGQGFERDGKPASSHLAQSDNSEQPLAPVRHPTIRQGLGMVDTFA